MNKQFFIILIIIFYLLLNSCSFVQTQNKFTYYKYEGATITRIDIRTSPYDSPCLSRFYYGEVKNEKEIPHYEIEYCGRDGDFSCYLEFLDNRIIIYGSSDLIVNEVSQLKFPKKDLYSKDFFLTNSKFDEYELWKQKCNVIWIYPLGEKGSSKDGCIFVKSKDWE